MEWGDVEGVRRKGEGLGVSWIPPQAGRNCKLLLWSLPTNTHRSRVSASVVLWDRDYVKETKDTETIQGLENDFFNVCVCRKPVRNQGRNFKSKIEPFI